MRHGERVDFTFGSSWYTKALDGDGNYVQLDLNMPEELPKRSNPKVSFFLLIYPFIEMF